MIDEDKIGKQEFQEVSEVPVFNLIGAYAQTKGYKPVYFKAGMPAWDRELMIFSVKDMQYIHLFKDEDEMELYDRIKKLIVGV